MEGKKEIRADAALKLAGLTLIPVCELVVRGWSHGERVSAYGVKRPLGVIVVSAGGKAGFTVTGEAVPAERLAEEFPGVATDAVV